MRATSDDHVYIQLRSAERQRIILDVLFSISAVSQGSRFYNKLILSYNLVYTHNMETFSTEYNYIKDKLLKYNITLVLVSYIVSYPANYLQLPTSTCLTFDPFTSHWRLCGPQPHHHHNSP